MTLSSIIVHYGAAGALRSCLRSLAASGEVVGEAFVVNNSRDALGGLKTEFPSIRWLQNEENAGFGAAVNRGARESSGELLVILNPDTELLPGSLQQIHRFFEQTSRPGLGPVGGRLLFTDDSLQPSCGPFPHLANLAWRLPLPAKNRRYYLCGERARGIGTAPVRVDWVTGAFMAVRRSVFDKLGGFDPDFFLYYEDVDFCLRAKKAGFETYYLPEAVAYHHNPYAARREKSPELKRIIRRSRLTYFEKHRPAWETAVLKTLHRLEPA